MDNEVETSLLQKLQNLGFNFGKGTKFQDLGTRDFLDVYKVFFRTYNSAWLLNDEKPLATVLKLIQGSVLHFFVTFGSKLFSPPIFFLLVFYNASNLVIWLLKEKNWLIQRKIVAYLVP